MAKEGQSGYATGQELFGNQYPFNGNRANNAACRNQQHIPQYG
jgi:hypothetical protein